MIIPAAHSRAVGTLVKIPFRRLTLLSDELSVLTALIHYFRSQVLRDVGSSLLPAVSVGLLHNYRRPTVFSHWEGLGMLRAVNQETSIPR